MTKELSNIQDLKSAFISHCKELGCDENYIKVCENKFSSIETVLKNEDEEKFKLVKQVRELKDDVASLKSFNSKLWVERQDNDKKLKAFEIIKEKEVNVQNFKNACSTMSYEQYLFMWTEGCFMGIMMTSKTMLTQEEYDLLKEVLLCQQ